MTHLLKKIPEHNNEERLMQKRVDDGDDPTKRRSPANSLN